MNIRHAVPAFLMCVSLSGKVLAQSSRSGVGAIPYADAGGTGVTFRTWAPNASAVAVRGGFNGWGSTALAKDMPGGSWSGYWSVDVPRAKAGDEYKFEINGSWRKDPRGRRVVNSAANSVVYDHNSFNWGSDSSFSPIWRNDLVIYEMHAGSYNAEDWLPSTFDECADKIAYLKALGVSAVELMPINEFPGDRSWGYNPSDPFAIESSHGGPDALKRFVKACHENGIAVLVDVVHNHYGPSDLEMWQFDGWSQNGLGGIFFYNEKWKAVTDWGETRPDYGRAEVKDFIQAQIQMFVEDYHIDGFRWDSVYNIRHYSDTWNQAGSDMLWQVNNWLETYHPSVFRIAEDHAFDSDVKFEAQWDHGFLNDIRYIATAANDADRNMDALAYHLGNGGFNRVVYVESHDTCGDLNKKHRLPYDVQNDDPEGYFPKKRSLLANTIALVSPGIPMIFAGSEMHEWYTFSNNQALRWSYADTYAGIVQAYADLIHLRRNAYGNTAALKQVGKVNVHHVNNTGKVVGLVRWDAGGGVDDVVIAINCSATTYNGYSMAFPSSGTWYCLYNSDRQTYDSEFNNVGPAIGGTVTAGATASLDLGPYSMQIYSKTPVPAESSVTFDPAAPDGCGATVTITYDPGDGPLKDASSLFAYIGRNNWQWASNVQMTASGDAWTLAYTIPDDVYELNLTFTDGAATNAIWDNNDGANWKVLVSNCGDLPAEVSLAPASPQGCVPVKVSYEINGGPLTNSTQVYAYIGRNGWQNIQDLALTNEVGDTWSGWYAIPDDTWELNYVFHNSSNAWDNHNGNDWRAVVSSCVSSEQPQIAITHPVPVTNVPEAVATMALQGTANLLTGHLRWTNTLNGAGGEQTVATNWSIASVPLSGGVNLLRVSGTNSAVNPNHGAWDSPSNASYVTPKVWTDGMDGGSGLKPWIINGNGISSARLAIDDPECSFAPCAWALQADNGGFVQAIRPFSSFLHPGDVVSFVFENGSIDSPGSVGVAFQNRFDQRLAEIYFEGGSTNFVLNDTFLRPTGIPWSDGPKTCSFEMLSGIAYRLTVDGHSFEGEFNDASELLVSRIRFWNYNAGFGTNHHFFVGALSVTGAPLPVLTYSAEVVVNRAAPPTRQTTAFLSTSNGFVATLSSVEGIESNVWGATALLDGGWNWALLPSGEYAISNSTVILTPTGTNLLKVYSIGKPGGN